MRDQRFVAIHRGGPLKSEQHRQLVMWACACAEHVQLLYSTDRLRNALEVAKAWVNGIATVGDARNAALDALAEAKKAPDEASIAVARAVGHAVATAHMADHAPGASLYALKAVKCIGNRSVAAERRWQIDQLPEEITHLVLTSMTEKERHFKLL